MVLAQLHTAFLRFHNAVIDHLRKDPALAHQSAEQIFKLAQRQVRWHYQWIILHEFLPLTIGQERVDDILNKGLRFYQVDKRKDPLLPIEFSVAAYRFGHSQIRPSYRLNFGRPDMAASPFFAFLFDDNQDPGSIGSRSICVAGSAQPTAVCRLADLLQFRRWQFPTQQND